MSKSKLTFYKQIPNSSMHIPTALSSFSVPMKRQPRTAHARSSVACVAIHAPCSSGILCFPCSQWTVVHPGAGAAPTGSWGKGGAGGRWRGPHACAQQQAQGRHELGKLSRDDIRAGF